MEVRHIDKNQCKEWLMYKHYAKRVPAIEYSFGLYENEILVGVCTFGPPPRVMNNAECIFKSFRCKTFELNRLCVNESLPKNTLSFFVSQCLNKLPKTSCIVSYADFTFGHQGYIYQATNWIYTGLNQIHDKEWFINGKEIHTRSLSAMGLTNAKAKKAAGLTSGEYTKKHRYFMFLASKTNRKKMLLDLVYPILDYPKGDNKKYDSSYKPIVAINLF